MSTPIVKFDRAKPLNLKFRINRSGSMVMRFSQGETPYELTDEYQVNIRRHGGTDNIIELTEGDGITIDGDELTITITPEKSDIPEYIYYWELYNVTTTETWFSGDAHFISGVPDDGDSTTDVQINLGDTIININLSIGGNGGGGTGDADAVAADLATHEALTNNPHSVTKTQIGLGNVDNTSDINKPVSTAQQSALDLKADLDYVNSLSQKIYEAVNIEDPTASDDIWIFSIDEDVTVTKVVLIVSGTTPSVTGNIVFGPNANTASPTKLWSTDKVITSETGETIIAFDNATITAGYHVRVKMSAISGTPTGLRVQIFGDL